MVFLRHERPISRILVRKTRGWGWVGRGLVAVSKQVSFERPTHDGKDSKQSTRYHSESQINIIPRSKKKATYNAIIDMATPARPTTHGVPASHPERSSSSGRHTGLLATIIKFHPTVNSHSMHNVTAKRMAT